MATKFKIIEDAKRQARMIFVGMAIPHQPSTADHVYGPIRSEKVLKFNRKALGHIGKATKENEPSTNARGSSKRNDNQRRRSGMSLDVYFQKARHTANAVALLRS